MIQDDIIAVRRPLPVPQRELLPDERQQRRVREVEQHGATGVGEQGTTREQYRQARRRGSAILLCRLGFRTPRLLMVYRSRRDGEHGDGCKRREDRHQ